MLRLLNRIISQTCATRFYCQAISSPIKLAVLKSPHTCTSSPFFWIESDIYYKKGQSTPTLRNALKTFEHTCPLKDLIIPCCEQEHVMPWTLLRLFEIHQIKLTAVRSVELLNWAMGILKQSVSADCAILHYREVLCKKRLSYLYKNLLHRHRVNTKVVFAMLDIMVHTEDHAGIEWIFTKIILQAVKTDLKDCRCLVIFQRLLQAIETISASNFSEHILGRISKCVASTELFALNSNIICSIIVICHKLSSPELACYWLHWHFQHLGHSIHHREVWKIYPDLNWKDFFFKSDIVFIDWCDDASLIVSLVKGFMRVNDSSSARNIVQKALVRIVAISTPSHPLLHPVAQLLELSCPICPPDAKDKEFCTYQSYAFLKVLCDTKNFAHASLYLRMATQKKDVLPKAYCEVLVLEDCPQSTQNSLFSLVHTVGHHESSAEILECYSHIIDRYIDHRQNVTLSDALFFLESLVKNHCKSGMADAKIDVPFAYTLYNQLDKCKDSKRSAHLFAFIKQNHPTLDVNLVQSVLKASGTDTFLRMPYTVNTAMLFTSIEAMAQSLSSYDQVLVLDTSAVELFQCLDRILKISRQVLLLVPFESLKEACLSIVKLKEGTTAEKEWASFFAGSIKKLMQSLAASHCRLDGKTRPGLSKAESHLDKAHVRLLHASEELLLHQAPGFGKKLICAARKEKKVPCGLPNVETMHHDNHTISVSRNLKSLLQKQSTHSHCTVEIYTFDPGMMNRAENEHIQASLVSAETPASSNKLGHRSEWTSNERYFNEKLWQKSGKCERKESITSSINEDIRAYFRDRKSRRNAKKRREFEKHRECTQMVNIQDLKNKKNLSLLAAGKQENVL